MAKYLLAVLLCVVAVFCCVMPAFAGLTMDAPGTPGGSVPRKSDRTYTCTADNGSGLKAGPTASIAADMCYGYTTHEGWGTVVRSVERCDDSYKPSVCWMHTKITYTPSGQTEDRSDGTVRVDYSDSYKCPDSSAANTTTQACDCIGNTSPDPTGQKCTPVCPVNYNSPVSSGYYDLGTNANNSPLLIACNNGCSVQYDGTGASASAMEGGVKHWYAKGGYYNSGGKCTEAQQAAKQIGPAKADSPKDSCAAGQGTATMNGKTVCVDQNGDGKTPTPASDSQATDNTSTTKVTNPDGSSTTTETRTIDDGNGHKQVVVTTTKTGADGQVISSDKTTTGEIPTKGSANGSTDGKDDDTEKGECEKNPSKAGCGGEPAAIGSLYTSKDKTLADVLSNARNAFMSSPVGGAVGGFFVVSGGGSCPTWQATIEFLNKTVTIDQFCSPFASVALAILKTALLVVASFFAFRIAVE